MEATAHHEQLDVADVIVNAEVESFLPQISQAQYTTLRDSIAIFGQREPIVLWDRTVIDGHNRLRVCKELSIPVLAIAFDPWKHKEYLRKQGFSVDDMTERDIVMHWVYESQCAKRNASRWTRCVAQMANEHTIPKGSPAKNIARIIGIKGHSAAEICAARAGVSVSTYRKARAIDEGFRKKIIPLVARDQLDREEVSISAVYRLLLQEQDLLEIKKNMQRTRVPIVGGPTKKEPKTKANSKVNHSAEGVGFPAMKKIASSALDEANKIVYNLNMHLHIFEALGKTGLLDAAERREINNSAKRLKKAGEDVAKALRIC